ncbi:MAG: hypothetical protein NZ992_04645 [Candidatus Korarchaeum sp.]|nr:hypothetical protein [Candidatus Korarchaeum sp.]MDW8035418.1 hypothetical protein [Candidatus Korarchaeum sp.]
MNRDTLLLLGVMIIVLLVLGSIYTVMYRGVAPSLLGSYTQTQRSQQTQVQQTQTQAAPFPFRDKFLSVKEFSVNYDVYVNRSKEGELAVYLKDTKSRTDFSKEDTQYVLIRSGNSFIICSRVFQQEWTCLNAESLEEAIQSTGEENFRDPVSEGQGFRSPSYNGSRSYAGQTSYCYYVEGEIANGRSVTEICITNRGVPVYYLYLEKLSDENVILRLEIVAKTISYSVQDTVFNPPTTPS